MVSQEILEKIYRCGTYYNPSTKHYGYDTRVQCDRCSRSHISISIGWSEYDICMKCIDEMSRDIGKSSDSQVMTYMMQSQFGLGLSRMFQGQFNTKK